MSNETSDQPAAGRKWSTWDYLWRGGLVALTLFVALATVLSFWYFVQHRHYTRQLAQTVDEIKAAGGPLDAEEIEAYYRLPEGTDDLTAEYLQALSPFFARQSRASQVQGDEASLPYVGSSAKDALVGPDWDLRAAAETYLKDSQTSLDQLRALSQRPGAVRYPVKLSDNIAALLPCVQAIRDAARHLQLDFDLQLLAGNRERALADLITLLKTGETLRGEPLLISQLVRYAVFGIFAKGCEKFLADGKATEDELKVLKDALADLDFQDGLKRALVGERSMSYLALKMHDASHLGQLSGSDGPQYIPQMGSLKDVRPGDTAALLQFESAMIEAADAEFPQVLQEMQQLDDELMNSASQSSLPWNRNILTEMMAPAMTTVAVATARSLAVRDALRVAVAIETMRARTGERPSALMELVPDYLPAVPSDPFTGGTLRYQVGDDNYVVYSLGKDKVDNGGLVEDSVTDVGVRITTASETGTEAAPSEGTEVP